MCLSEDQREIRRKLRLLRYAEEIGRVARTVVISGLTVPISIAGAKPIASCHRPVIQVYDRTL